jgi:hypothetical protein
VAASGDLECQHGALKSHLRLDTETAKLPNSLDFEWKPQITGKNRGRAMPFPRRNDPRYRETVPCISLRQLRKAGALKPGMVTALRWYEDHEGGLVMVCHTRTDEPTPWAEWNEVEPVHEASISLWRGLDRKTPKELGRVMVDGIEVRYTLENGKVETSYARFSSVRAGFGMVQHLECGSCDRRCDVLCLCLFSGRLECSYCCRAPYRSQHRNRFERALIKADRIRRKLGDTWLNETDWPSKPPKMRWKTYERLSSQAWQLEEFYYSNKHRCRVWR